MKLFWLLWIAIASLLIALGVSLIVLSAINFSATPLVVVRLTVGILWAACGIILLTCAVIRPILKSIKNARNKRKK